MKNPIYIHVLWDKVLLLRAVRKKNDDCLSVALIVKVTKRLMRGDGLFVEKDVVAC